MQFDYAEDKKKTLERKIDTHGDGDRQRGGGRRRPEGGDRGAGRRNQGFGQRGAVEPDGDSPVARSDAGAAASAGATTRAGATTSAGAISRCAVEPDGDAGAVSGSVARSDGISSASRDDAPRLERIVRTLAACCADAGH